MLYFLKILHKTILIYIEEGVLLKKTDLWQRNILFTSFLLPFLLNSVTKNLHAMKQKCSSILLKSEYKRNTRIKQSLLHVVSDHDQVDMEGELLPEHPQPYPS